MYRFFIPADNLTENQVRITDSDYNHIAHVLRLKPGDEVIVTTGQEWDYTIKLVDFKDDFVTGEIIKRKKNNNEPGLEVTLAQGIPKKGNMELIIQKCTEIGIKKIIPLETSRTIVKLRGNKREKRVDRWQRIAEEAAKQSQRGGIPVIDQIIEFEKLTEIATEYDLILIPYENERTNSFKSIWLINSNNTKKVLVIIGPEGGFTEKEVLTVKEMGGISVTLGPRILRTETAGMVVLTMLLYESGDLEVR